MYQTRTPVVATCIYQHAVLSFFNLLSLATNYKYMYSVQQNKIHRSHVHIHTHSHTHIHTQPQIRVTGVIEFSQNAPSCLACNQYVLGIVGCLPKKGSVGVLSHYPECDWNQGYHLVSPHLDAGQGKVVR